jgi:hypothetical protein
MREEIILDIAELIQDYFAWVEANPIEARKLFIVHEPVEPNLQRGRISDLLGFSRWLALNSSHVTNPGK